MPRNQGQLMNEYKSGKDFRRAAERSDACTGIRQGRGDHFMVEGEIDGRRSSMTVPDHREIATGTRSKILKWFVAAGIIVPMLCCFMSIKAPQLTMDLLHLIFVHL